MYSAQAHLADAYLAGGLAAEARFIAEDLVAREPWDRSNLERFRRALELLGEPDPEALIAERLSGQSPFMTTDLFSSRTSSRAVPPSRAGCRSPGRRMRADAGRHRRSRPRSKRSPRRPSIETAEERPGQACVEAGTRSLRAQRERDRPREHPRRARIASGRRARVNRERGSRPQHRARRHQTAFETARAAGCRRRRRRRATSTGFLRICATMRASAMDEAEQQYKRGLALREAGDIDGCITALQAASQAPRLRFATASILARIFRDRGMTPQAVEWFERAAQAPAPNAGGRPRPALRPGRRAREGRRDGPRARDLPGASGRRRRLP